MTLKRAALALLLGFMLGHAATLVLGIFPSNTEILADDGSALITAVPERVRPAYGTVIGAASTSSSLTCGNAGGTTCLSGASGATGYWTVAPSGTTVTIQGSR